MFTIPIWDILGSYTGDSKKFSFSGEIFDGFFEDILFRAPLSFQVHLIGLDDGISCTFENLTTEVFYEWLKHSISIPHFERMWKSHLDPLEDADDVQQINMKNQSIDFAPVIREEIIMACHAF